MVLPTRLALRRKPVDPEDNVDESLRINREWFHPDGSGGVEYKAKCRLIIVGFHDPDILELEVSAPAPELQTVNIFLSASAGMREEIFIGDMEDAFQQGKRITRLLFADQPKGVLLPDMAPGQIYQLEVEVYGTVRGSANWRETAVEEIVGLGYKQAKLDACLFYLPPRDFSRTQLLEDLQSPFEEDKWLVPRKGHKPTKKLYVPNEGRLILLTDDVADSGNQRHRKLMEKLQERFRFGKYRSIRNAEGGTFNGRKLWQYDDYGVKSSMQDYIEKRVHQIPLSRERPNHLTDAVTEQERAILRSAGMVQHWCARNVHYEALGGTSILSRHFNNATVHTVVDANKIAKHMKENKYLGLIVMPIDPAEAVGGVSCDGGLPEKGEVTSTGGLLVFLTTRNLKAGEEAPVNFIAGRSGEMDRMCSSSLAVEAYSMVAGVGCLEWTVAAYGELTNAAVGCIHAAAGSWLESRRRGRVQIVYGRGAQGEPGNHGREEPPRRAQEAGERQGASYRPGCRRDTPGDDRVRLGRAVDTAQPPAGRPPHETASQGQLASADADHAKRHLPAARRGGRVGLQEAYPRERSDVAACEGQGASD